MPRNLQILLRQRPIGFPKLDDFELAERPIVSPSDGEVLTRALYLSLDPYMRNTMNDRKSYIPPTEVGAVMRGQTVAEVVESKSPALKAGDLVHGFGNWQEYSVNRATDLFKIDPSIAPAAAWLGPLGLPGWTAYIGLTKYGEPKAGETLVVSSAAGAVGSLVGQLAKEKGLRVVGIAGGPAKCAYVVDEFGFDACVDYKAPGFPAALAAACPQGIDIDFENAGGAILEAVWPQLNTHARVVICGLLAQYNATSLRPGPNLAMMLIQRIRMQGFIILDHLGLLPEVVRAMAAVRSRSGFKFLEHIVEGLENAPQAFISMLQGSHLGKTIVRI